MKTSGADEDVVGAEVVCAVGVGVEIIGAEVIGEDDRGTEGEAGYFSSQK